MSRKGNHLAIVHRLCFASVIQHPEFKTAMNLSVNTISSIEDTRQLVNTTNDNIDLCPELVGFQSITSWVLNSKIRLQSSNQHNLHQYTQAGLELIQEVPKLRMPISGALAL